MRLAVFIVALGILLCLLLVLGAGREHAASGTGDTLLLAYGSDPNTLNAITSSDTVSGASRV